MIRDIISDFMSLIGVSDEYKNWQLPKRRNESLGSRLLEMKRIINTELKDEHEFYKTYDFMIDKLNSKISMTIEKKITKLCQMNCAKKF